jgi:hypothetical protein
MPSEGRLRLALQWLPSTTHHNAEGKQIHTVTQANPKIIASHTTHVQLLVKKNLL